MASIKIIVASLQDARTLGTKGSRDNVVAMPNFGLFVYSTVSSLRWYLRPLHSPSEHNDAYGAILLILTPGVNGTQDSPNGLMGMNA